MTEQNPEDQLRKSCGEDNGGDNQNGDKAQDKSNNEDTADVNNEKESKEAAETDENLSGDSYMSSLVSEARCSESMPSSDSNKENVDSNSLSCNSVENNMTSYITSEEPGCDEYDKSDIPLPQLLKIHMNQLVSGFEFGEATKRRAQENMKSARDRKMNELRKSEERTTEGGIGKGEEDEEKPGSSKGISENDHKTPHSHKRQKLADSKSSAVISDKDFSSKSRQVPDCLKGHPNCIEVWNFMIYKEEASLKLRNPRLFHDFKSVTPRMRAILLDWLMEVSSVYHLRRVTYYLSVDYFDRFLSIRPDIPKSLLQLVGITCLYIASKVEEIYPPNLNEFSYVCDGACNIKEMVSCELLILNSLGWEVVLTTPSDWLNLYMQLHFKGQDVVRCTLNLDFNKDFLFPQYSAYQFTRASQLMDLLSLDPGFLKFSYSVIAAAAMRHMYGEDVALSVSGLTREQLKPCSDYMEAFRNVIKDAPDPRLYSCLGGPHPEEANRSTRFVNRVKEGPQNENYSFQTHVASMEYFEKATAYRLSKLRPSNSTCEILSSINEQSEGSSDTSEESVDDAGAEDPPSLEEELEKLSGSDENEEPNVMSLDEIFELILTQEELDEALDRSSSN